MPFHTLLHVIRRHFVPRPHCLAVHSLFHIRHDPSTLTWTTTTTALHNNSRTLLVDDRTLDTHTTATTTNERPTNTNELDKSTGTNDDRRRPKKHAQYISNFNYSTVDYGLYSKMFAHLFHIIILVLFSSRTIQYIQRNIDLWNVNERRSLLVATTRRRPPNSELQ